MVRGERERVVDGEQCGKRGEGAYRYVRHSSAYEIFRRRIDIAFSQAGQWLSRQREFFRRVMAPSRQ